MIQISKRERLELEKLGFRMGDHIFHTVSNKKKYYISESPKIKQALWDIRENEVRNNE